MVRGKCTGVQVLLVLLKFTGLRYFFDCFQSETRGPILSAHPCTGPCGHLSGGTPSMRCSFLRVHFFRGASQLPKDRHSPLASSGLDACVLGDGVRSGSIPVDTRSTAARIACVLLESLERPNIAIFRSHSQRIACQRELPGATDFEAVRAGTGQYHAVSRN